MNKVAKIIGISIAVLVCLLVVAISLTVGWRPFFGPKARALTSRTFERTPQRIERGHYLFTSLGCTECHTPRDTSKPGAPIMVGSEGTGGVLPFDGLPGRIVAPNLTPDGPTGTGSWTDDQFARAIREGIGHDGRTLFPIMPYGEYRIMSDEDLASIVVYIRTLPAVHHELPKTDVIFPVKYLINNAPQPISQPVPAPDSGDLVKRGEYMATIAGCAGCHTPSERGKVIPGMEFSGGNYFSGAGVAAASANITPDASGIGYYDENLFMQVVRTGMVRARKLAPIMPFSAYKNLTDDDLKAIFAYLRTVKPVKHRVDNSLPPTLCKLCRQKHGAGDQN